MHTETHPETAERGPGRPRKRSPRGPQYDPVTVQLPPDLIQALDAATEAEGLDSRSAVITPIKPSPSLPLISETRGEAFGDHPE